MSPRNTKEMAEANDDNALFAIEVDVDDYAETAAADNPSSASPSAAPTNHQNDSTTATMNSRTFQSASAFQAQKAAYRAKIDQGGLEAELVKAVPALKPCPSRDPVAVAAGGEKVRLSKKESQLLGYAVGEMYFSRRFGEVVGLCERVLMGCELDVRTRAGVEKWMRRSRERLGDSCEG
ncbi:hypothetical protein D0861_06197 [Hortaea werneckii]|uniref:Uncharacterized protein n=1 Tax=Hortaea werneckii TaxID=91943 RepID=A0A3M7FC54_HORWE|nr:hypothetical protein D0861_06197 [Hortaea werneckii]